MQNYTVFDYHLTIRESRLDTFGHVNNAAYLEILEEARWDLMNKAGLTLEAVQASGKGPTILEINIRYKRELRARMAIIVRTQLESISGKIGVIKQWIDDDAGNICCEASMKFGIFDLTTRRLILPPDQWLHAFGA